MEKNTSEKESNTRNEDFKICFGEFTQEEKEHLLKIGHIFENSDGEIFDASTLSESAIEGDIFDLSNVSVSEVPESQVPCQAEHTYLVGDEAPQESVMGCEDVLKNNTSRKIDESLGLDVSLNANTSGFGNTFDVTQNEPLSVLDESVTEEIIQNISGSTIVLPEDPINELDKLERVNVDMGDILEPKHTDELIGLNISVSESCGIEEISGVTHNVSLNKSEVSINQRMSEGGFGLHQLFPATPVTTDKMLRRSTRVTQKSCAKLENSSKSESVVVLSVPINEMEKLQESGMVCEDILKNDTSRKIDESLGLDVSLKANKSAFGNTFDVTQDVQLSVLDESVTEVIKDISESTIVLPEERIFEMDKLKNLNVVTDESVIEESKLLSDESIGFNISVPDGIGMGEISDTTRNMLLNKLEVSINQRMSDGGFGLHHLFPATPVTTDKILRRSTRIAQKSFAKFENSRLTESAIEGDIFDMSYVSVCKDPESQVSCQAEHTYLVGDDESQESVIDCEGMLATNTSLGFDVSLNANKSGIDNAFDVTQEVPVPLSVLEVSVTKGVKDISESTIVLPEEPINEMDKLENINVVTDDSAEPQLADESSGDSVRMDKISDVTRNAKLSMLEVSINQRLSEGGFGLHQLFPATPVTTNKTLRRSTRIAQKSFAEFEISSNWETRSVSLVQNNEMDKPQESFIDCEDIQNNITSQKIDKSLGLDISSNSNESGFDNTFDVTQDVSLSVLDEPVTKEVIKEISESVIDCEDILKTITSPKIDESVGVEVSLNASRSCVTNAFDAPQDLPLRVLEVSVTKGVQEISESPIVLLEEPINEMDKQEILNVITDGSAVHEPKHADESIGFNISVPDDGSGIEEISDVTQNASLSMLEVAINQRLSEGGMGLDQLFPATPVSKRADESIRFNLSVPDGIGIEEISDVTRNVSLSMLEVSINKSLQEREIELSESLNTIEEAKLRNATEKECNTDDSQQDMDKSTGFNLSLNLGGSEIEDLTQDVSIQTVLNRTFDKNESKEDLDDTIETMNKLLALADEQEAKDNAILKQMFSEQDLQSAKDNSDQKPKHAPILKARTPISNCRSSTFLSGDRPSPKSFLAGKKTNELKSKASYSSPIPSCPKRTGNILKTNPNSKKQPSPQQFKLPTPRPVKFINNSSTPSSKFGTPRRRSLVGVVAKVDSGFSNSSPGASLCLNSPVANYIHSKAAPSPFHRIPGVPNKAQSTGKQWPVRNEQIKAGAVAKISSMIPRPSLSKVAVSNTMKRNSISGVMSESKFNSRQGGQGVVALSEIPTESKFKQRMYTGPSEGLVRPQNDLSFDQKHHKENYKAQRHMGKRDSGNASIVQNAVIPKQFLPSRLLAPKNQPTKSKPRIDPI